MRFPEADAPAPRRILTQRDVDEMRRWSANIDLARARCGRKYPRPNWEYVAELSGRGVNNVQKILKGTFVTAAEKAAKAGRARPQGGGHRGPASICPELIPRARVICNELNNLKPPKPCYVGDVLKRLHEDFPEMMARVRPACALLPLSC